MFEIFRSARLRRLFLCETILILMVAVLSVRLRFGLGIAADDPLSPENWPYWLQTCIAGVTIPIAVQLAMYYLDLYSSAPLPTRTQLLSRLFLAHLGAGVALALIYYLVPTYRVQRLALAMTLTISSWLLFSLRYHLGEIIYSGGWRRRVLIVGTGRLSFMNPVLRGGHRVADIFHATAQRLVGSPFFAVVQHQLRWRRGMPVLVFVCVLVSGKKAATAQR